MLLRASLLVVLLASSSLAQFIPAPPFFAVKLTGQVLLLPTKPGGGPTLGEPVPTHVVGGTSLLLLGQPGVDLSAYEGQVVTIDGFHSLGFDPLFVSVHTVSPAEAELVLCSNLGSAGCSAVFRVLPGGLQQHWLFVALETSFTPAGPVRGTWWLGEAYLPLVEGVFSNDPLGGLIELPVPTDAEFVGVQLHFQAARRQVGPVGPIALSNPVFATIQPATQGCSLDLACFDIVIDTDD